jgi:predicted enzyme related to lactoylglutathione lyase
MADGFIWYELVTNDMDKAVAFYSKVVGWDIRDSGMPGMRYMLFGKDGKDVGGIMTWAGAGAPEMPPEWMGHIHTAKLDAELEAVTADGGMIIRPASDIPGVGRFAVVLDPQKVKYLLFEPLPGEAAPARLGQSDLGNVGWHELLTDNWEKAWEYYSKHYGWEKDFAHDMGPMGIYQTFRMDQPMFSGGMMSTKGVQGMPEGTPSHWRFYLVVDNVDAAVQRVTGGGGKVLMGPHDVPGGSRILQAIDDQGAFFALTQNPKA